MLGSGVQGGYRGGSGGRCAPGRRFRLLSASPSTPDHREMECVSVMSTLNFYPRDLLGFRFDITHGDALALEELLAALLNPLGRLFSR